jgi:hypothetical protein
LDAAAIAPKEAEPTKSSLLLSFKLWFFLFFFKVIPKS